MPPHPTCERRECVEDVARFLTHVAQSVARAVGLEHPPSAVHLVRTYGANIRNVLALRGATPAAVSARMASMNLADAFDYFVSPSTAVRQRYAQWFDTLAQVLDDRRLDAGTTLQAMAAMFKNVEARLADAGTFPDGGPDAARRYARATRAANPSSSPRQFPRGPPAVVLRSTTVSEALDEVVARLGVHPAFDKYASLFSEHVRHKLVNADVDKLASVLDAGSFQTFMRGVRRRMMGSWRTVSSGDGAGGAGVRMVDRTTRSASGGAALPDQWTLFLDTMLLRRQGAPDINAAEALMDVAVLGRLALERLDADAGASRSYLAALARAMAAHCRKKQRGGGGGGRGRAAADVLELQDGMAFRPQDRAALQAMGLLRQPPPARQTQTGGNNKNNNYYPGQGQGGQVVHVQHHDDPYFKCCLGCLVTLESCECMMHCVECLSVLNF